MKEFDFGLSWSVKTKDFFTDTILKTCQSKKLSFIWCGDDNVNDIIRKLESDEIRIRILLDTEATYNKDKDLYARLCYAVKDAGGVVINDPDRARLAVDKSVMHRVKRSINNKYSGYKLH